MNSCKDHHLMDKLLLHLILPLNFLSLISQSTSTFCGKTEIPDLLLHSNSTLPLSRILHCSSKSQNLYFRTSLGLFPISSIDSQTNTLTISHPSSSCPSTKHYISPSLLAAGFPSPPQPNSILLFNCSNSSSQTYSSQIESCGGRLKLKAPCFSSGFGGSCLMIMDLGKVEEMGFRPEDLRCSHYQPIHRRSLGSGGKNEEVELGTRVSFDLPDHVPNPCEECEKKGGSGDCGVGLKCLCHPQLCRDKVVSGAGRALAADGIVNLFLFSVIVLCTLVVGV